MSPTAPPHLPRRALDSALHAALPDLDAVVDAARAPDAWRFVREASPDARCLFTGPDAASVSEHAPYVVSLDAARLDLWLARAWGNAWGVLVHTTAPAAVVVGDLRRGRRRQRRTRQQSQRRALTSARSLLLRTLALRGLALSEAQHQRATACDDLATLTLWHVRAVLAASADEVFA